MDELMPIYEWGVETRLERESVGLPVVRKNFGTSREGKYGQLNRWKFRNIWGGKNS